MEKQSACEYFAWHYNVSKKNDTSFTFPFLTLAVFGRISSTKMERMIVFFFFFKKQEKKVANGDRWYEMGRKMENKLWWWCKILLTSTVATFSPPCLVVAAVQVPVIMAISCTSWLLLAKNVYSNMCAMCIHTFSISWFLKMHFLIFLSPVSIVCIPAILHDLHNNNFLRIQFLLTVSTASFWRCSQGYFISANKVLKV